MNNNFECRLFECDLGNNQEGMNRYIIMMYYRRYLNIHAEVYMEKRTYYYKLPMNNCMKKSIKLTYFMIEIAII